ncbi:hypothetical protein BHM03_00054146 [Ensete ventricosum]|nr:hypothetical protein BHM03_00054146 [Ensete ventricosum]
MRPARPFEAVLHSYVASGAQRFWSRSRVLRHHWVLAGRVLDLRPLPCILSIVLIPRHRMRKQGGFLKKLGSEPAFDREARLG